MAINNIVLMGRITKELELKQTQSGKHVLSFTIAVDSNYKQQDGTYKTNFINCVAWEQKADFIARYFGKGAMIAIIGELNQRTYQGNDGKNHSVHEVYVSSVSFTGEKKQDGNGDYQPPNNQNNGGYNANYQQSPQNNGYNGNYQPQNNGYNNNSGGYQQQPQNVNMNDFEDIISDGELPF